MTERLKDEESVKEIANYCARDLESTYQVIFPEGDLYRCRFENGEYVDNDEELDSPAYEEWYVVDFEVIETVRDGPNRDPRYGFVTISHRRMPSLVTCDGEVVYQAGDDAQASGQAYRRGGGVR